MRELPMLPIRVCDVLSQVLVTHMAEPVAEAEMLGAPSRAHITGCSLVQLCPHHSTSVI